MGAMPALNFDIETLHQQRRRHLAERADLIRRAVIACDGNRTEAARLLSTGRVSLLRFIRDYGIDVPETSQGRRPKRRTTA